MHLPPRRFGDLVDTWMVAFSTLATDKAAFDSLGHDDRPRRATLSNTGLKNLFKNSSHEHADARLGSGGPKCRVVYVGVSIN